MKREFFCKPQILIWPQVTARNFGRRVFAFVADQPHTTKMFSHSLTSTSKRDPRIVSCPRKSLLSNAAATLSARLSAVACIHVVCLVVFSVSAVRCCCYTPLRSARRATRFKLVTSVHDNNNAPRRLCFHPCLFVCLSVCSIVFVTTALAYTWEDHKTFFGSWSPQSRGNGRSVKKISSPNLVTL